MRIRRICRTTLLLASSTAILALLALPAEGAFPGRNGAIVFSRTYPHSSRGDIWKMRRRGGSADRLTTDSRDEREPAWSSDGTSIVFERAIDQIEFQLAITESNGRTSHVVGGGSAGGHATWSPSGKRLAYSAFIDTPAIAVLNVRSGVATPILSRGTPSDPAWSPVGSRIAYEAKGSRGTDLFAMTPGGHDRVRLTQTPAWEFTPDWSPNGKQIVFIRARRGDGPGDIFVITASGESMTRLTDTPFDERSAAFSPNGNRIVFSRCCFGESETSEIFVMHSDGTHVHRLTHNNAEDTAPDWQPRPKGH